MTDITQSDSVWVSTSKNGDYVQAVPHEGAVEFVRASQSSADFAAGLEAAAVKLTEILDGWEVIRKYHEPGGYSGEAAVADLRALILQPHRNAPSDKIAEAARLVARSVDDDMSFFNKVALSFDLSPDMPVKHFFAHALMHFADAHERKIKA